MKVLSALVGLLALGAVPVYADCLYPAPPEHLPDGHTATMAEMVAGQKAVKDYDRDINAYVACLKLEHDHEVAKAGDKPTPDQKKALDDMERVEVQKHNAAIDQLQSVADRFNEQVRVFKAKSNPDAAKK